MEKEDQQTEKFNSEFANSCLDNWEYHKVLMLNLWLKKKSYILDQAIKRLDSREKAKVWRKFVIDPHGTMTRNNLNTADTEEV